jgi:5,10-methylene-tetrahydrofolate dehydrogenase/methenyl tetrahydrofolate cyclohydrolase
MTAQIIDGKAIAEKVRQTVAEDVATMVAAGRPRPGLRRSWSETILRRKSM